MDEQQVRELVRQALIRHLGPPGRPHPLEPAPAAPVTAPAPVAHAPARVPSALAPLPQPYAPVPAPERPAISHAQFQLTRPAGEVECLIEPSVICNHCGYCQCYGH